MVWCSGGIIYLCTGACQQITDMVKQLNYVWLIAKIPYSGLFLREFIFGCFEEAFLFENKFLVATFLQKLIPLAKIKGELTWKIYLCILLPKYVYLLIQCTKNMF